MNRLSSCRGVEQTTDTTRGKYDSRDDYDLDLPKSQAYTDNRLGNSIVQVFFDNTRTYRNAQYCIPRRSIHKLDYYVAHMPSRSQVLSSPVSGLTSASNFVTVEPQSLGPFFFLLCVRRRAKER